MATATFDLSALSRTRPVAGRRARDARVLVGLMLAMAVFAAGLGFWTLLAGPQAALAVQRDIPAGATLTEADFAITRVRVDGALADRLIPAENLPALAGRRIAEPLHAGELLLRAHVAGPPGPAPGMVLAAVPLTTESGPGSAAQPGSRVRVLATIKRDGGSDATTAVVLPDAEVIEVVQEARSALLTGGETRPDGLAEPIVFRVLATEEEAAALARAKVLGTIEVVLLGPRDAETAAGAQAPPR